MEDLRRVLIVDDSETDREVLKGILSKEFDVLEADNGYAALKRVMQVDDRPLDVILLDISMPILDGFSVLRALREQKIDNIPVFLMTAEATKDNVAKAAKLDVSEFIKKPFDREEIIRRLKAKLGIVSYQEVNEEEIKAMNAYISKLEKTYTKYLNNFGKDVGHYTRMVDIMKIMLSKYSINTTEVVLNREQIEIISKAAFFCDIGFMMLPDNFRTMQEDERDNDSKYQSHTMLGADVVKVNPDKQVDYFVQICADMCMHHHERYDGSGYPDRIFADRIPVFTQMCKIAEDFDNLYYKYREHNELQFDFVINDIKKDKGSVSQKVSSLLSDCKFNVVMYYSTKVK